MIWWRGNGLWAAILIALIVVSADKAFGTDIGVRIGLVSSAALVFLLRDFFGKESSVYSIPVRFWPVALLILAIICK
jgi:hypothetical protein